MIIHKIKKIMLTPTRMLKVARLQDRIPAVPELHRFILCTRRSWGKAHEAKMRVWGATSQLDLRQVNWI